MKIYYFGNGSVLGTWGIPNDPFFSCDSHTNPTLADAINANPSAYSVIDGVLTRDGAPVAINPPCDDCAALDALDGATTVAQLRKALIVMRDKPGFTRG